MTKEHTLFSWGVWRPPEFFPSQDVIKGGSRRKGASVTDFFSSREKGQAIANADDKHSMKGSENADMAQPRNNLFGNRRRGSRRSRDLRYLEL